MATITDHTHDAGGPRAVISGAFELLGSLHALGTARVSELQRHSGLPRTTVHRLLTQLQEVGAVERSATCWRLGPKLVTFGASVPAEPRLRSIAKRPLMDLASASGALVALSVGMADKPGHGLVVDVLPGTRPLALEPQPGMLCSPEWHASVGLDTEKQAGYVAHERARRGDLRPVVDVGGADPRTSCVAAPLRLSPRDFATVSLMVPGRGGIPAALVEATQRTARRIALQLSQPVGT